MERTFTVKVDDVKCLAMMDELARLAAESRLIAALLGTLLTGHTPTKDALVLKIAGIEIQAK